MRKLQKYLAVFQLSFIHTLRNYKALVGLSIFLVTCLIIFANLWKIAAAKQGAVSLSPEELLWYIAFNEWVIISLPDTHETIEQDLRTGKLAYLLSRPISYPGSIFAEAAGALTANMLALGTVTFLFTWYQAGALPFQAGGFIIAILFGLSAGVLAILFGMLIGLSAFWLHETDPFFWIWEKLLFMLGGLMLPLTVYPQWLQAIAHLTPFPLILGERSALAIDFNLQSILMLSTSYLGWGAFAVVCVALLYRKGLRIVNIEGG